MIDSSEVFDVLFDIAKSNTPVFRTRHAACIVYKNKYISFGVNSNKTHPLQSKFSKHEKSIYLHAEIDAINNARDKIDLSKCSLYVARVKWNDSFNQMIFGLSKPCDGCMKCIKEYKIKHLIYSMDE